MFTDDPSPSVAATFELFSNADAVFGMHGAGLANAVFVPPGGHLIEVMLPEKHARYFEHLANANGLVYHGIALEGTGL